MLWSSYVYRRGVEVDEMWDEMFSHRLRVNSDLRVLYIAGNGFDLRAQSVAKHFVEAVISSNCKVARAKLVTVQAGGYELTEELKDLTAENARGLSSIFARLGLSENVIFGPDPSEEADLGATASLRIGVDKVLALLGDETDVVLDVSSMPRVVYLSIMLAMLARLVPESVAEPLASRMNFHVVVGEDAALDGQIRSEDPDSDLILLPGYSLAMQAEAMRDVPLVWFPILGEGKLGQLSRVEPHIPPLAEICPVVPHPTRDLRRGDDLLAEHRSILFDTRATPVSNVLYAHESHPFEAYRQLLGAMRRYRKSLSLIGGCRIAMTPLGSKLITLGAGLACFEMQQELRGSGQDSGVAIPYAEPRRYSVSAATIRQSKPQLSAMVLTGDAYRSA